MSFASALLGDGSAPSDHVTQYYEMFGSRALYHDGWKAVVFHPTPFIAYDGSDVSHPFDEDVWELYHVAEDFSEVADLAATEPEQLQKMKDLWWEEAAKYQVLPLNNEPTKHRDQRHRRLRFEFRPGIGPIPEFMAPSLKNRAFVLAAELMVPATGEVAGVLAAHGSHSGGWRQPSTRCSRSTTSPVATRIPGTGAVATSCTRASGRCPRRSPRTSGVGRS